MKSNATRGAGSRVTATAGQMLPAAEPAHNKPNKARYTGGAGSHIAAAAGQMLPAVPPAHNKPNKARYTGGGTGSCVTAAAIQMVPDAHCPACSQQAE